MQGGALEVVVKYQGRSYPLTSGSFVGRSMRADLPITEPFVAEFHAAVSMREEGPVLLPLRGGLYRGDDLVGAAGVLLEPGLHIGLGDPFETSGPRAVLVIGPVRLPATSWSLTFVGLDDATVPLPDDDDLDLCLLPEPPWVDRRRGEPRLGRRGGAIFLTVGKTSRDLDPDTEHRVEFPGVGVRFVRLVARPRGSVRPTEGARPVRVHVRGYRGHEQVGVYPADGTRSVLAVIGKQQGAFLAEVLRHGGATAPVDLATVANAMWRKNAVVNAQKQWSLARGDLGPLAPILRTLSGPDEPTRLVVELPHGSTVHWQDDLGALLPPRAEPG